ncbi:Protein SET DOMAIN GROUP 40 [Auxenochlorella protothecoides]|uniref:Protein SET DOMAIN GROUP 40 n=1 Tax=Auxenochlorella protothecoides TaxID=3075 RepID=A0A087SAI3_AUXPR|nr:Protein SET DOMAIN GROUP 40 [Auxenochlorella protothecoides]KFM22737.1 Protein SET DOMAIN GROUP 40 [Auxenochlorella protothecoides]
MVEAVPQLISWLESRGGRLRDIEAGEVAQGGRGIVATRDIAPGACVLEVPFPCLMTCSSALACPTVSAVVNAGPLPLTPFQVLTIHVLFETSKKAGSAWWPYLQTLPHSYTSGPYFAASDLDALAPAPSVHRRVAEAAQRTRRDWHAALPALRAMPFPDDRWRRLGAWRWAAATLGTRTMYLPPGYPGHAGGGPLGPGPDPGGLTPLGDLHNYAPPAGPLVFLDYGRYTNAELMQLYGFVLRDNPHDAAPLEAASFCVAAREARAFTWLRGALDRELAGATPVLVEGLRREEAGQGPPTPCAEVALAWLKEHVRILLRGLQTCDTVLSSLAEIDPERTGVRAGS